MKTRFLIEPLVFENKSTSSRVIGSVFSNIHSNQNLTPIYHDIESQIQIQVSSFAFCINQKDGLMLFQNGIIQGCTFISNNMNRDSIFYSKEKTIFEYCCASNTSQVKEFFLQLKNEGKLLMSNFSETKSEHQSCTGTIGSQSFIQRYINYYKCGKDWGGASIEYYIGIMDISYSNYIDVESTGESFIILGSSVKAKMSKCFFRIKGYRYLIGLFKETNSETITIEDCIFITENINHDMRYLTTKNVIIDSTKLDYSFVNIPYLKTDFIKFDETDIFYCIFSQYSSYYIFYLVNLK